MLLVPFYLLILLPPLMLFGKTNAYHGYWNIERIINEHLLENALPATNNISTSNSLYFRTASSSIRLTMTDREGPNFITGANINGPLQLAVNAKNALMAVIRRSDEPFPPGKLSLERFEKASRSSVHLIKESNQLILVMQTLRNVTCSFKRLLANLIDPQAKDSDNDNDANNYHNDNSNSLNLQKRLQEAYEKSSDLVIILRYSQVSMPFPIGISAQEERPTLRFLIESQFARFSPGLERGRFSPKIINLFGRERGHTGHSPHAQAALVGPHHLRINTVDGGVVTIIRDGKVLHREFRSKTEWAFQINGAPSRAYQVDILVQPNDLVIIMIPRDGFLTLQDVERIESKLINFLSPPKGFQLFTNFLPQQNNNQSMAAMFLSEINPILPPPPMLRIQDRNTPSPPIMENRTIRRTTSFIWNHSNLENSISSDGGTEMIKAQRQEQQQKHVERQDTMSNSSSNQPSPFLRRLTSMGGNLLSRAARRLSSSSLSDINSSPSEEEWILKDMEGELGGMSAVKESKDNLAARRLTHPSDYTQEDLDRLFGTGDDDDDDEDEEEDNDDDYKDAE